MDEYTIFLVFFDTNCDSSILVYLIWYVKQKGGNLMLYEVLVSVLLPLAILKL
jgi:hypothetical protein